MFECTDTNSTYVRSREVLNIQDALISQNLIQQDITLRSDKIQTLCLLVDGMCMFSNKWHTGLLSPWQASCPAMHDWNTLKGKWLINIASVCYLFIYLFIVFHVWPVMENKASLWFCCGLWYKAFHCFLIFSVLRRKLIPWGGFIRALLLCYHQTLNT